MGASKRQKTPEQRAQLRAKVLSAVLLSDLSDLMAHVKRGDMPSAKQCWKNVNTSYEEWAKLAK